MDAVMATETLLKGKEDLIQLMKLLENPSIDINSEIIISDLVAGVSRSFHHAIQLLNSSGDRSIETSTSTKRPAARDRRGCYKRRKSDSWNLSPTMDDGYSWRKYGQKFIHSQTFPRSYFRCTHKKEGCKAKKQVHKWEEDPSLYRTTYFGQHTCSNKICSSRPSSTVDADTIPVDDPYIVNIDSTLTPTSEDMCHPIEEDKSDIIKLGDNNTSEVIDSMMWQDLVALEASEMAFNVGFEDDDASSMDNLLLDYSYGGLNEGFEVEQEHINLFY